MNSELHNTPAVPPSRFLLRFLPLLLASISGAAGLAHQLLWVRRMVDVLGANAGTFTRVIAAFFLGLAAGAWLASRTRTPRPWRSIAIAEGVVAVLALGVLCAPAIPAHEGLGRLMAWLLPLVFIVPPAFAMGTVIPWMIRAVGPRLGVPLYGVNTLGGIAGILIVFAWALPVLGHLGASLVAIGLNVIVAGAAWALSRSEIAQTCATPIPANAASTAPLPTRLAALSFASGFLVLASEVIYQQQFAQFFVSSFFSSAAVLILVLSALGVGALLAGPLARILGCGTLPAMLALASVACVAQPVILVVQHGCIRYLPLDLTLPAYAWEALKLGLPACALLLLPAAIIFPTLLRPTQGKSDDPKSAPDAGALLAVNGVGGWFGAEFTERILAPTFGIWWSMTLIGAGYAVCIAFISGRSRWWLIPGLLALASWSWTINGRLPFAGMGKGETLVRVAVGREGVVGVVRGEPDDWRIIFNNNYTLGGSRAQVNQERQTLLPMLLHGDAKSVATLGVATGSSLAGATLEPILTHAEGIELSPLVLRFSREYFGPYNHRVADDPRVRLTVGDARIVIAQRPGAFDVVVGDLFLPWRTGEARLFSREHFQNVRAALKPGGLYCQWLPMYQLTREQFDTIARTFREIFPEAWIVRGDFYTAMPIIGLVGGRNFTSLDWEKIRAACDRTRALGRTRDPLLRHAEGVAMCVVGPLPPPTPGTINTLANSWLEWECARNLFGQRQPWFNHIPLAVYLRGIHRQTTESLPASLREAHLAGDWFHAFEIAGAAVLPQAHDMAAEFQSHLPPSLRQDTEAEWRTWPMRHMPRPK